MMLNASEVRVILREVYGEGCYRVSRDGEVSVYGPVPAMDGEVGWWLYGYVGQDEMDQRLNIEAAERKVTAERLRRSREMAARRQAEWRRRRADEGLQQVTVMVPADRVADIKDVVRRLLDGDVDVAMLRDRKTGRLVRI